MPSKELALARHTEFYIERLFDEGINPEVLWYDAGQIALAIRRIRNEEVGAPGGRHVISIETKFKEFFEGRTEKYLGLLFEGKITVDNYRDAKVAVGVLENGLLNYSLSASVMKKILMETRKRLGISN